MASRRPIGRPRLRSVHVLDPYRTTQCLICMRVCNTRLSSAARRGALRTVRLATRLRDARVVVRALAFSDRQRRIGIGRCMFVDHDDRDSYSSPRETGRFRSSPASAPPTRDATAQISRCALERESSISGWDFWISRAKALSIGQQPIPTCVSGIDRFA
jgi:hypothetical protein